jgi:hypothetical protein
MTNSNQPQTKESKALPVAAPFGFEPFDWRKPDPIVQAVWDIKAQINRECDYSVDKVFEMVKASRQARLQAEQI